MVRTKSFAKQLGSVRVELESDSGAVDSVAVGSIAVGSIAVDSIATLLPRAKRADGTSASAEATKTNAPCGR